MRRKKKSRRKKMRRKKKSRRKKMRRKKKGRRKKMRSQKKKRRKKMRSQKKSRRKKTLPQKTLMAFLQKRLRRETNKKSWKKLPKIFLTKGSRKSHYPKMNLKDLYCKMFGGARSASPRVT